MPVNSTIEKYKALVEEQTGEIKIDYLSLTKKLAALPKWTTEWINLRHTHQAQVDELENNADDFKTEAIARYRNEDNAKYANMSDKAFSDKVASSTAFKKLRRAIRAEQRIVDYLDEVIGVYKFQFGRTLQGLLKIRELDG
jgi:acetylornithine deacetylase/succinyl-diaminopimelate desuccinylase-like protein